MADARNGDVDAIDHHQEPAHHLASQRAALMRLELMRLHTPPHTGLPNDDGRLSGAPTRQATSCSVWTLLRS